MFSGEIMGLCTGIVRDAWGRKRVGREFGTKNGGGVVFSFIKR